MANKSTPIDVFSRTGPTPTKLVTPTKTPTPSVSLSNIVCDNQNACQKMLNAGAKQQCVFVNGGYYIVLIDNNGIHTYTNTKCDPGYDTATNTKTPNGYYCEYNIYCQSGYCANGICASILDYFTSEISDSIASDIASGKIYDNIAFAALVAAATVVTANPNAGQYLYEALSTLPSWVAPAVTIGGTIPGAVSTTKCLVNPNSCTEQDRMTAFMTGVGIQQFIESQAIQNFPIDSDSSPLLNKPIKEDLEWIKTLYGVDVTISETPHPSGFIGTAVIGSKNITLYPILNKNGKLEYYLPQITALHEIGHATNVYAQSGIQGVGSGAVQECLTCQWTIEELRRRGFSGNSEQMYLQTSYLMENVKKFQQAVQNSGGLYDVNGTLVTGEQLGNIVDSALKYPSLINNVNIYNQDFVQNLRTILNIIYAP